MSSEADSRKIAIVDLITVSHIAQVLLRTPGGGQVALLSDGKVYEDPDLTRMLETGLVITYGRVFKGGQRMQYTPIPRKWIPPKHLELHDFLIDRRNRYYAHTDSRETNLHRRRVGDAGGGWFSVGFPEDLSPTQLENLVELAQDLRVKADASIQD